MTRDNGQDGPSRTQQKVARLLEQLPPHSIEAEMCVLASIILKPAVLDEVTQLIGPDDFYKPAHGEIFRAMVRIYEETKSVDIVLLHQRLVDQDILEAVGGQHYLVDLANEVPSADHAAHYAREVRDKSLNRQIIEQLGVGLNKAYRDPRHPQELLDTIEAALLELRPTHEQKSAKCFGDVLSAAIDSLDPASPEHRTLKTGFFKLDELTGGLRKGEVTVIAGRPSMGKTALAMNMAVHIAQQGAGVLFFSLEMSERALALRVLSGESGVWSQEWERPDKFRPDVRSKLQAAAGRLYDIPLRLDELTDSSIAQLRARARLRAKTSDLGVIFVDYLQLLSVAKRTESRRIEVDDISRAMKSLALELDVPVVCLSQLNRASEQRQNHVPQLSDLRESGAIEQDADVVLLLHREEYYHKTDEKWMDANPDKVGVASLIIAKQRNGPTGVVTLTWHGPTTTFKNYTNAQLHGGPSATAQPAGSDQQQGVLDEVGGSE